MTNYLFKCSFGQCACKWCGRGRYGDCRVTYEVRMALKLFAHVNGRMWKSKLREIWMQGDAPSAELQQARNIIGPSGLDRITPKMLAAVPVR